MVKMQVVRSTYVDELEKARVFLIQINVIKRLVIHGKLECLRLGGWTR